MIYFLASTLSGRDGGSRAGADILNSMLALGRHITVVCNDRCYVPHEIDSQPIPPVRWIIPPPIYKQQKGGSPKAFLKGILKGMRDRFLRLRFERKLQSAPATLVVHNGFPVPGSINNELLERSNHSLIIIHSSPEALDFFQRRLPDLTRESVSEKMRKADNLVFVSPQIRDAWTSIAGLQNTPTFVVVNTTREDDVKKVKGYSRTELRQNLQLPEKSFIVCCVGKVDNAKGQDILVKALPQMIEMMPNLHVVFVGIMTPFGQHLPGEIEAMGLGRHATFTGGRDDVYSFIRASDMLIHPSRAEGLPLVVLEAMVLNTPVLASNVGGIPFCIEHGESGWLVPPDDPSALTLGFKTLVDNPQLLKHIAVQAEVRYWTNFSRKMHRDRYQSLFNSILSNV